MSDLALMRIDFLKQFTEYVKTVGNEDVINYWFNYGVPDVADDDILNIIVSNNDDWLSIVTAFSECCKMAGVI